MKDFHKVFTANGKGEMNEKRERERERRESIGRVRSWNCSFGACKNLITHRKMTLPSLNESVLWGIETVWEPRVLHPQDSASRQQTEICPEWQSECQFPAYDQRALWLCTATTRGFTVPTKSEERELRGQAREGDQIGREEAADQGCTEMKVEAKECKRGESRMAKHG